MEQFNFDAHFQKHYVNHLLRDTDFLSHVYPEGVARELFSDEALQRVVILVKNFYDDHKAAPGTLAFRALDDLKTKQLISDPNHRAISEMLDELFALPLQNRSYLIQQFEIFARSQRAKQIVTPFVEYVKKGDFDSVEKLLKEYISYRPSKVLDIGARYEIDPSERIARRLRWDEDRLWTLFPEVDVRVDGLLPGELFVWQSQRSSSGKSAALQNLTRNFAYQGKKTLVFVLEGSREAWEDRLDQCVAGLVKDKLTNYSAIHAALRRMSNFGGDIWIKSFPMYKAKVSDLIQATEMIGNVANFHPEVIVVDYADLLLPETDSLRGKLYEEGRDVYQNLLGWIQDDNLYCHTAMQSGRGAMDATAADQQHSSGSITKAQIAQIILSINSTPAELEQGIIRLLIVKNREGKARYEFQMHTDLSRMAFRKDPENVRQDSSDF